MKRIINIMIIVQMLLLAACTSDEIIDDVNYNTENDTTEHVVPLILNVTRQHFDDEPQTRGEYSNEWEDGTMLYVQLKNGSNWISGTATYVKSVNMWAIRYTGTIVQGTKQKCMLYYFVNPDRSDKDMVTFTTSTAVYMDGDATYNYQNGKVIINATLKPQTARIRFKGTPGQSVTVSGLEYLLYYDITNNTLERQSDFFLDEVTFEVGESGYTQMLYVNLSDKNERKLSVWENHQTSYNRVMNAPIMSEGSSGCLTIPTQSQSKGWTRKVHNVFEDNVLRFYWYEYRMIPVEGGMFQMGNSQYGPIHGVILDSYLIGETEVPQGLWYAVRRDKSGDKLSAYYAACHISWEECNVFCQKLNSFVGMSFRMPTEAEWEFAARGGNQSKGYQYSGSNYWQDVAGSFNRFMYPIKRYKPNELGIYDMTGNVSEFCSDYYADDYYSVSPLINPQGPKNGEYIVVRDYHHLYEPTDVFRRSSNYKTGRSEFSGLRLAL